jgi:hypothetical protein
MSLKAIASAMGGEVSGGQVLAPGPGHSKKDRSLSIRLDPSAPDGFIVNTFAEDDPIAAKDYVRATCGADPFKPGKGNGRTRAATPHVISDEARKAADERVKAVLAKHAARTSGDGGATSKGRIVDAYDYTDTDGTLLYQVIRYEPKNFKQRRPDGNSGWIWDLNGVARVPFNLKALADRTDQSAMVFFFEGEKDALRGKGLGLLATTISGGTEWPEVIEYFAGREVIIVPDHDEAGIYKGWQCADALHGVAASIRMVKLPGLSGRPGDKDFSDWLDAVPARADTFVDVCLSTELWTPCPAPPKPAAAKNSRRKRRVTPVKYFDEAEQAPEYSDEALALCFAEQHQAQLRYVAFWSKWLIWRACRWIDDSTLHAFSLARQIARTQAIACDFPRQAAAIASAKTVAAIERLAKADRRIAAADSQWDADLCAFNTPSPEEMTV